MYENKLVLPRRRFLLEAPAKNNTGSQQTISETQNGQLQRLNNDATFKLSRHKSIRISNNLKSYFVQEYKMLIMLFDSEWRALKWSIVQCVYSYTIILLTCFTLNEWLE